MAYVTTNPPYLVSKAIGGKGNTWRYESTDPAATVDGDGYITNAESLGMKVNDTVEVVDTDATPPITTRHTVVAINANGSADLSNSDGTDSD